MARKTISKFFVSMTVLTYLASAIFIHAQQKEKSSESPNRGDVKLAAGDHARKVRIGNLERRYRIYIPKRYDANKATHEQ
jgi:hypothetical protein